MFKILKKSTLTLNLMCKKMSSAASSQPVLLEKINQVGLITLNRPKQLNALNLEMVRLMQSQLIECDQDKSIKCVVVKGAGESAFCAGGDVKSIRDAKLNGQLDKAMEFFRQEYILDYEIAQLRKPYVALLNGICMGGGVGISVHGKYRVATDKTLFAMPETAIGFFADVGGSHFLPRLPHNLGLYLALTGARLKGKDVKSAGLATHFVSAQNVSKLEHELLHASDLNEQIVEQILDKFNEQITNDFDACKIANLFAASSIEQIIDNLEKDASEWSKQQLKLLAKMSPTSLKVTVKQLQMGAQKSLKECLEMEYRMGLRFLQKNDFSEGVRALLIDKDNKPKWQPSSLSEIAPIDVDWYFSSLPNDDKLVLPKL